MDPLAREHEWEVGDLPDDPPSPADQIGHTVAQGRRRGPGWTRVSRGIHRRSDAIDVRRAEAQAWHLLLPADGALAGLTAAYLRGWDLPRLPASLPVFAAMPYGCTAPIRPGLRTTRHRLDVPQDVVDGLRVTTPEETLVGCASILSLLDLVVLTESALRARDLDLLGLSVASTQHRRGVGVLREALTYVDPGAESVPETLFRMLHVSCDLDVVTQHRVFDAAGNFVARGDLWLRGTRTLQEYDGAQHGEPEQRRHDLLRARRLAMASWTAHSYSDVDLFRRPAQIIAAADRAVGRMHTPGRLDRWNTWANASTITSRGRALLLERVIPAQSRGR